MPYMTPEQEELEIEYNSRYDYQTELAAEHREYYNDDYTDEMWIADIIWNAKEGRVDMEMQWTEAQRRIALFGVDTSLAHHMQWSDEIPF